MAKQAVEAKARSEAFAAEVDAKRDRYCVLKERLIVEAVQAVSRVNTWIQEDEKALEMDFSSLILLAARDSYNCGRLRRECIEQSKLAAGTKQRIKSGKTALLSWRQTSRSFRWNLPHSKTTSK